MYICNMRTVYIYIKYICVIVLYHDFRRGPLTSRSFEEVLGISISFMLLY